MRQRRGSIGTMGALYDAIVAGAGPGGAATAIHLARAGLSVALIDWQSFPRDKVCGDFLSPVALRELQALGITRRAGFKRSNPIRRAAVFLDGAKLLQSPLPAAAGLPRYGRVIPREIFDEWIVERAQRAGAQLFERHRVLAYKVRRDRVEVTVRNAARTRTLHARVLIGADGSTSTIARQLRGNATAPEDRVIAVRAYYSGLKGPADRADLYFASESFPGYCWVFPTGPGTANVGVGMVLKTVPPMRDHLRELLQSLVAGDPALRKRLGGAKLQGEISGWPLSTYNGRLLMTGARVLLVGDAAGLINPLNGEGIQYALLSAKWAAETIVENAAHRDFSAAALASYAGRLRDELSADLSLSRTIVDLIRNRALNSLWLEALQTIVARAALDSEYARVTGGVLAGILPTTSVLSLPIVRKTIEQAAFRLGSSALSNLSLRPNELAALGIKLSEAAISIASTLLAHQSDTQSWGFQLATSALDLAGQVGKKIVPAPPRTKRQRSSARHKQSIQSQADQVMFR